MNPAHPAVSLSFGRLGSPAGPPLSLEAEMERTACLGFERLSLCFGGRRDEPLLTARRRTALAALARTHGLAIGSIYAEYFLGHPLVTGGGGPQFVLERVVDWASELGASYVSLPIAPEVATVAELGLELSKQLAPALGLASARGISIALGAPVPARALSALILRIDHPNLGLAYDTGMAAEAGLSNAQDLDLLAPRLVELRVGDAEPGSGPCSLGRGRAGLPELLARVTRERLPAQIVLCHHVGADAEFDALRALNFVRLMCARGALGDAA